MDTPCDDGHAHYWYLLEVWVDELGIDWWVYYCAVCNKTEMREANLPDDELASS